MTEDASPGAWQKFQARENSESHLRLVVAVQRGDAAASEQLLREFRYLAINACGGLFGPGLEPSDLVQHAMIGLWRGAQTYDVTKSDRRTIVSWLWHCARMGVIKAVSTATRRKHEFLNGAEPLFYEGDLGSPNAGEQVAGAPLIATPWADDLDPAEEFARAERRRLVWAIIHSTLSPLERQVIGLWLGGQTYADVAAAVGATPKSIDNAIARIKRKLRTDRYLLEALTP